MTRCVGQYEIKETLGKGGYSWVKKGIDTKTGNPVALKFMARADKSWEKEQAEQVRTEIKSMIRINSKYVMKLFAYNLNCKYPEKNGKDVNTILLVLEFCPGGELFDILYYTQQLDEKTARTYFQQMIYGLKDCHDSGIIHRDIKPQNLLMDGNYQLKITDFGLSFLSNPSEEAQMKTHYVGTRGYQAPELLRKKKYGKACDIFSAAVVLFILLTGYPPFEQASKQDKWYQPLALKNQTLFWNQHKGCGVPQKCQTLLTHMLAYNAKDRYTIEEIMNDPWFRGDVHSPSELASVLRKKHKESVARRKKDKKKMSEMQDSMRKKRATVNETIAMLKNSNIMPEEKEINERKNLLTNRWVVQCSEPAKDGEIPKELLEGYEVALKALEFDGKAKVMPVKIKSEKGDMVLCPWKLDVTVKASATSEMVFKIRMEVLKQKGENKYIFTYNRMEGDTLHYRRLWDRISLCMMAEEVFADEFEDEEEEARKEGEAVKPEPVAVAAQ